MLIQPLSLFSFAYRHIYRLVTQSTLARHPVRCGDDASFTARPPWESAECGNLAHSCRHPVRCGAAMRSLLRRGPPGRVQNAATLLIVISIWCGAAMMRLLRRGPPGRVQNAATLLIVVGIRCGAAMMRLLPIVLFTVLLRNQLLRGIRCGAAMRSLLRRGPPGRVQNAATLLIVVGIRFGAVRR